MSEQLRYVVLRHEGIANPHFDLMYEWRSDAPLKTLRYRTWPPANPAEFERLPDHRRDFLDYEGAISNNRGLVKRVAQGFCTCEVDGEDSCIVELDNGMTIRVHRAQVK